MKAFYFLLAFTMVAAAQTVKTVSYNTSNNRVVVTNTLEFTNNVWFGNGGSYNLLVSTNLIEVRSPLNFPISTNNVFEWESASTTQPIARTNLGLGWPALTNSNAAATLLGYATNGQVVTGTNTIALTNRLRFPSDGSWSGTTNLPLQIGTNDTGFYVSTGSGNPLVVVQNATVSMAVLTNVLNFYKPLRYNSSSVGETNAPANTTNVNRWIEVQVGTSSYRLPLYQ